MSVIFSFICLGDGRITVAEFLDGAIRLRGLAKSVDLAQARGCVCVCVCECVRLCDKVAKVDASKADDSFRRKTLKASNFWVSISGFSGV